MTLLLWVLTGAGCTSSQPPVPPDLPPRSPADLGAPDAAPPDPGPRAPWHAISPTPGDSDLQDVDGASLADYYVISAGAVIHRAVGQDTVEWQGAACLHGLRVAGGAAFAAGGCQGDGVLLSRQPGQSWHSLSLPNLSLGGLWAQDADEVYVASPAVGVVHVQHGAVTVERTVLPGELGLGPVAVFGVGDPADVYAVGGGRVLHRRGPGQWDVERSVDGEQPVALWGRAADDLFVAGSSGGAGHIWHRVAAFAPFMDETIDTPGVGAVAALWGGAGAMDPVYAAADGGMVLRRDPVSGHWAVDRPGAPDQPAVRALWGADDPEQVLAVGPGGIAQRAAGPQWSNVFGQALTGATLRAAVLSGPGAGLVAGDAGVVLRLSGGKWQREAVPGAPALAGLAASADGTAYAVGAHGLVLRRGAGGTWQTERDPMALPPDEPDLLAVALAADGSAYAVGAQGRILSRLGGTWQALPPVPDGQGGVVQATLRAAAVLADGTVAAAGEGGTVVWQPAGAAGFRLAHSDPAAGYALSGLSAFAGPHGPELWASARGAALVLRLRGGQFTTVPAPLGRASAVYAAAADDVYLAGCDGSVWHYDGRAWGREPAPLAEPLLALGGAGQTVVAVGAQGFMMQRP